MGCIAILFFLLYIITVLHGSSLGSDDATLLRLSSMPLKQLILSQDLMGSSVVLEALLQRPELKCIKWSSMNRKELAYQLWLVQKEDASDMPYHRKLNNAFRSIMIHHDIKHDQIQKVMGMVSSHIRQARKREHHERRKLRTLTPEQISLKKAQRISKNKYKRQHSERGLSLPLLSYLTLPKEADLSPRIIHEAALKYRDKYWSCRSFIHALKQMWKTLGIADTDVIDLNLDKRNYVFSTWPQTRTNGHLRGIEAEPISEGARHVMDCEENNRFLPEEESVGVAIDQSSQTSASLNDDQQWLLEFPTLPELLMPKPNQMQSLQFEDALNESIFHSNLLETDTIHGFSPFATQDLQSSFFCD